MNWEAIGAIGEILGALTVLITLIYLARQIQRLSQDAFSFHVTQVESGGRHVREQTIQHANLVIKAIDGAELTREERITMWELYLSHQSLHFFAYIRARNLGMGGDIPVQNMINFLEDYPCFLHYYENSRIKRRKTSDAQEFVSAVDAALLQSSRGATRPSIVDA